MARRRCPNPGLPRLLPQRTPINNWSGHSTLVRMKRLAAVEVAIVFLAIITYIWQWRYAFPDQAVYTLAFIVGSFFIHRDKLWLMGMGTHGLLPTFRRIWMPTVLAIISLLLIGWITRS